MLNALLSGCILDLDRRGIVLASFDLDVYWDYLRTMFIWLNNEKAITCIFVKVVQCLGYGR